MAKTQIVETFMTKGELLEQAGVNDAILCRAKYQICSVGEKNRNNRVYEKAVWDKVLADPEIAEKLKNRALFFHAEHPTTTQSNTEKVAGVVTNITLNEAGKKVHAVMEVLNTPYGRIVDTLLRAGCGIGVSTRADGELEEALDEAGGKYQRVIPESYRFVTIDFTADPSTFGSELPIAVERDVAKVISGGLDDNKLDRDFATVLLEKMHSPEAAALLESIKNDKHHADCKCKASAKKCAHGCERAITEDYKNMTNHELIQFYKESKDNENLKKVLEVELKARGVDPAEHLDERSTAKLKKYADKLAKQIADTKDNAKAKDLRAELDAVEIEIGRADETSTKYTTSADITGQPANGKAAAEVMRKSAKKNKIKITEQEVQTCSKCGVAFNALRQGSNPHRCKYDYVGEKGVAVDGTQLNAKVNGFLLDNWEHFIDHDDAVQNVIKVFKIGENDAKVFVDSLETSKGKISAVGAMSNEKVIPSGIGKPQEDGMSERLASITAERDQLVENYGKDAIVFTTKIKELKDQLKEAVSEVKKINGLVENQKEQLETSNATNKVLEETHKLAIKNLQAERKADARRHTDEKQTEIRELKESHCRDLIKVYVGAKTKGMGLHLPKSALTLLESCTTVEEVDVLVRRTQNALRENLVQSAGVVSEIVVESQSDPSPVLSDIRSKVGIALKHFGV